MRSKSKSAGRKHRRRDQSRHSEKKKNRRRPERPISSGASAPLFFHIELRSPPRPDQPDATGRTRHADQEVEDCRRLKNDFTPLSTPDTAESPTGSISPSITASFDARRYTAATLRLSFRAITVDAHLFLRPRTADRLLCSKVLQHVS
jgi:hypothetical protein